MSFEEILSDWQERYGTKAVPSLMKIASDRTLPDPDRYIALMGSAKLGGEKMMPVLNPFLKDPSWMIRSAILKIVAAFDKATTIRKYDSVVLKALHDPALVVRAEAINTLEKIKTPELETALLDSLADPTNYHRGVAQFVPQRALRALMQLPVPSKEIARQRSMKLEALADSEDCAKDAAFKKQIAAARALLKKSI